MEERPATALPTDQFSALAAAAVQGAADPVSFVGVDGSVLYANQAACDELQVPFEQVVGATIFDFLPELTPEEWSAHWVDFRAGGRLRFLADLRRRDGTLCPVDVHVSRVALDGIEVALVIARDVSERRRSEQALRESEEAYRALAENNPSFVARWDRDQRVLYCNPSGAALGGQTPAEVIGRTAGELLAGTPASGVIEAALEEVFRTGEPVTTGIALYGRDYELRVAPERSATGEVVSVLGVCTDLTEQKALERELRESRDFVEQVISSAEEGIVVVDRQLRYLIRNRFMEELTGIPSDGLYGVTVTDRPLPQLDELIRYLEKALAGETVRSNDRRLLVKPGMPETWVQATYSPMRDANGDVSGVIMIAHDVTARRVAEREQRTLEVRMLEAQRLESLGVLAGGIAHDFNNLLVGILGNASLALTESNIDEGMRERLREIEVAGRRAADLTRQMLAYAGRGRVAVSPLDLSELVTETIDLVRTAIPRSIRLDFSLDPDLPPVIADRSQLQQVAMNLVINAGEAVDGEGGVVLVATRCVDLSREQLADAVSGGGEVAPGRYVVLEVTDSGQGMDEATVAHVFEPFFSRKGPGRGLGLSSVLGIVRAHRGALRVESTPGEGTVFRVLLPAALAGVVAAPRQAPSPTQAAVPPTAAVSPPAGAPPSAGGPPPAGAPPPASAPPSAGAPPPAATVAPPLQSVPAGQLTVLLVEDDEAVARTVRRMLENDGYRVIVAVDGREALTMFRERSGEVAAVVLDLAMPELGGGATYRELRAMAPRLPVLITSGYADGEEGVPAPDDLNAAFLAKPYAPVALTSTVGRLVGRDRKPLE